MINDEAETYCTSRGYHLVEIFNQDQQDFIAKEAENIGTGPFWIGLKRLGGVSTWKWIHSKKIPQFTSWGCGEPNLINAGKINRLALMGLDTWFTDANSPGSGEGYAICQFDL